jgi:hypothetical protein
LIHYGVISFMLEKLGAVVGVSNLHIYAAMRGESLEDFQKTRNAPAPSIRWPAKVPARSTGSALPLPPHDPSTRATLIQLADMTMNTTLLALAVLGWPWVCATRSERTVRNH